MARRPVLRPYATVADCMRAYSAFQSPAAIVLKQGHTKKALQDLQDLSVIVELGDDRLEITEIDQVITAYRYVSRTGLFHLEVTLAEGPKNPSRIRS